MNILIVSDLHNRWDWYAWVAGRKADLTLVAGDLLDGFDDDGILPQVLLLDDWCDRFEGALALCSGNHDANDGPLSPRESGEMTERSAKRLGELMLHPHWMDALEGPRVVTDRRSSLLSTPAGKIVVTTCPYAFHPAGKKEAAALWREGAALRRSKRLPWIVLHHDPPESAMVGGMMGDPELPSRLREARPDFLVSGHLHDQPYTGSFAEKIGSTWCFNPGQTSARMSPVPNHIMLDLAARTATWHATDPDGKTLKSRISLR